ncbi:MAG: divalent metal cation transporter, partial [Xanthobacteraceae bacterium]
EAEEQRIDPSKRPLKLSPSTKDEEFARIRGDTLVGMAVSNIIAIAIIITTAATLHAHGKTNIETSAPALADHATWSEDRMPSLLFPCTQRWRDRQAAALPHWSIPAAQLTGGVHRSA